MNLQDDLRLLQEVSPGGAHEGAGVYSDPRAVKQLQRHIEEYHRHGSPYQVEYHSQREKGK